MRLIDWLLVFCLCIIHENFDLIVCRDCEKSRTLNSKLFQTWQLLWFSKIQRSVHYIKTSPLFFFANFTKLFVSLTFHHNSGFNTKGINEICTNKVECSFNRVVSIIKHYVNHFSQFMHSLLSFSNTLICVFWIRFCSWKLSMVDEVLKIVKFFKFYFASWSKWTIPILNLNFLFISKSPLTFKSKRYREKI